MVFAMVNRIIIYAYASVYKILIAMIITKIDHYSFKEHNNVLHHFGFFSLAQAQFWTLTFSDPLLKCFFMHFPNYFLVGNFVKSAWLCHRICASWEPWIYQFGALELIHLWPENWIVTTDWITSLDLPFMN